MDRRNYKKNNQRDGRILKSPQVETHDGLLCIYNSTFKRKFKMKLQQIKIITALERGIVSGILFDNEEFNWLKKMIK
jgi:hypothetical protein